MFEVVMVYWFIENLAVKIITIEAIKMKEKIKKCLKKAKRDSDINNNQKTK
jgi:hypothetical protein